MCNSIHQCLRYHHTTPISVPNTAVALKSTARDIVSSGAHRLFASHLLSPLILYTTAKDPWRVSGRQSVSSWQRDLDVSRIRAMGPSSMEYSLMRPASSPRNADGLLTGMNWGGIAVPPQWVSIRVSLFEMAWRTKCVEVRVRHAFRRRDE